MIRAVLIDALNTIFVPRGGKTRYDLMRQIIYEHTGQYLLAENIARVHTQKRKELEHLPAETYKAKWVRINATILADLGIKDPDNVLAVEMNDRLLADADLYEVSQETYAFLERMNMQGIKVIVASNNDAEPLQKMIGTFHLAPLVWWACSSQEIGHEKPSAEFFRSVLERAGLQPEQCVMIGNNPHNDMEGCSAAGIAGVLYDPEEKYPDYRGFRIHSLSDVSFVNL